MSRPKPSPRLFVRLAASHVLVTGVVGLVAAAAIVAVFYVAEDRVYESVARSALADPEGPLGVWTIPGAPPEVVAIAEGRADGVFEVETDGDELHVGVDTLESGERRVAVLQSGEVGPSRFLPLLLAGGVLGMAALAMGVGIFVARRTLAPLELLSTKLDSDSPAPTPDDWLAIAGDDEVGRVAHQLARYLEQREAALVREHEFLRDASHELRNPLSVLHGGITLLRETGVEDEGILAERLDRMDRSVARMRRTVEGLLTMARQETAAAREVADSLEQAVEELADEYRSLVAEDVELRLSQVGAPAGPAELWIVILRNLIDNSVRATSSGVITVHIARSTVRVEDTGAGMDQRLVERASRAFEGGAESRGFGLGLAIVHRFARRMSWEVEVSSSGAGTRVSLSAPIGRSSDGVGQRRPPSTQ